MAKVAYGQPSSSSFTTSLHSTRYRSRAWDPSIMSSTSSHTKKYGVQSSGYGQPSKYRSRSFSTDRTSGGGRVSEMANNYQHQVFGTTGAQISEHYSTESGRYGTETRHNVPSYKPPSGGTRKLPPGPGYHDGSGRRLDTHQAISDVSTRLQKKGPLKAIHGDIDTKAFRGNSPRPLSRGYESKFDSMTLNDSYTSRGSGSNLTNSRKYGSTSSLKSTSRDTFTLESVEPLMSHHKTSTHRMNISNDSTFSRSNGSSQLPHLSDSKSSSLSRDNSLESSTRGSHQSGTDWYADETTASTTRPSRRISEVRENGIDTNVMFRPDVNNNQGLTGLANIGNTCFMNSVTQCLSNTRPLLEYFANNTYRNSDKQGSLTNEFARVLAKLWESSRKTGHYSNSFSARDFKQVVSSRVRKFMGNNQHDAQEFLVYLIQGLHEDSNKEKSKKKKVMLGDEWDKCSAQEKGRAAWDWYLSYDNSFFVSTFVGQLKSTLECTVCGYKSNTFDPFWDISLPIRKLKSYSSSMQLEDCFDIFMEKEKLEGNESPTCAKCKKRQPCVKGLTIWRFPRILILELKRFEQHLSGFRATKLNTRVDFPTNRLDLGPYTDNASPKVRPVYNLYAVVKHSGTPSGGHYTADAKHPYSHEWHTFNDASVSTQSENRVVDSGAYVLFYELADAHSKL